MAEAMEKSPELEKEKNPQRRKNPQQRKNPQHHRKRIPTLDILTPILSGQYTRAEMARKLGVTRGAITHRLQRVTHLLDENQAKTYEEKKGTILSNAEVEILGRMLKPKTLSKANLPALSSAYKVCFDANRLVRGRGGGDNSLIALDLSGYRPVQLNIQVNTGEAPGEATGADTAQIQAKAGSEAGSIPGSEAGGGPPQGEGGEEIGNDQI